MAARGRSVAAVFFMTEGGLDFFREKDIENITVEAGMVFTLWMVMAFMFPVCLVLNSTIRFSACRLPTGSHESWALLYPFHLTLYYCCFLHPKSLASNTCSTSHSSSLSIRSGGSLVKFSPCSSISLYGDSRLAWNMLWIFQFLERFNWYATCEMMFVIMKGPCHLAHNLMAGCLVCRFFQSSQTLSPVAYAWNFVSLVIHSWARVMLAWTFCLTRKMCLILSCWSGKHEIGVFWCIIGIYPMRALHGAMWVIWDRQQLMEYCAMGNNLAQLFCCLLQKILRKVLSIWLVHSDCPSVCGW